MFINQRIGKVLSLVLAAALCCSLSTTAFAEVTADDPAESAEVTIASTEETEATETEEIAEASAEQPQFEAAENQAAAYAALSSEERQIVDTYFDGVVPAVSLPVSTYTELWAALLISAVDEVIITNDIQLEAALEVNRDFTFTAQSGEVTLYSRIGYKHIKITADAEITFNNVILEGAPHDEAYPNSYNGGIAASGVSAIINNPVIVKCNNVALVTDNCVLTVNGGEVRENYSTARNMIVPSGVYLSTNTIATLNNMKIIDNYSDGDGTGVHVFRADVTITGNTQISGNYGDWGGGVFLGAGKLTIEENVKINNNSARFGGGISVQDGDFFMKDNASITENIASNSGGGIYAYGGTFHFMGGAVINNEAPEWPNIYWNY